MVKCVAEKCDYFNEHGECSNACINNGYTKVLTNYDRIQNMSIEEMSKFLSEVLRFGFTRGCYDDTDPHFIYSKRWLESEVADNE